VPTCLTVRFQINRIELQKFDGKGAIASLKAGQNLTVRFRTADLKTSANARSLKLVDFDLKEAIAPQMQNSKNSHNGWLN
jgi:hypothetical protein